MDEQLTIIAPDIYQLRLPLPFALNHVNVYLLRGVNGWTILDTGINTTAGQQAWQAAFTRLNMQPGDIEKIVLTHVHPDHFGLAGWLQAAAAAQGRKVAVYVSPREDQQADVVWRKGSLDHFASWLQQNGMPDDMANHVDQSMGNTREMTLPHPPQLTHIALDDTVLLGDRVLRVIHAPGHSDGQLIFYDELEKRLFSGDHVLMTITPNIGLWPDSDPNPLALFMTSLAALRDLPVQQALPGHRRIITDWAGRIDELIAHHHHRLEQTADAVKAGHHTPYAVANQIFVTARFTVHEWRFAIAETRAHLEYLRVNGTLRQHPETNYFEV